LVHAMAALRRVVWRRRIFEGSRQQTLAADRGAHRRRHAPGESNSRSATSVAFGIKCASDSSNPLAQAMTLLGHRNDCHIARESHHRLWHPSPQREADRESGIIAAPANPPGSPTCQPRGRDPEDELPATRNSARRQRHLHPVNAIGGRASLGLAAQHGKPA